MKRLLLLSAIFIAISATLVVRQTINSTAETKVANAEAVATVMAVADTKEVTPVPVVEAVIPADITVTVNPGDSLVSIAEANQTTSQRLYDANTAISDPSLLNVGQIIRIPRADEVLVSRPMPVPAPKPVVQSQPVVSNAPAVASGSVWDQMSQCEAGGVWSRNSGNGYYGGLQFSLSTWRAVGGQGLPSENTREEQIARAEILLARSGWGQWPACARKLGLL